MSASGMLPLPPLGLSPEEAASRFDLLQQKLIPLWSSIRTLNQDEQTIVVLPSLTAEVDIEGAEMQAYEERFLFLLLLLRQPRARLIYVTSQSILPSVIEYKTPESGHKETGPPCRRSADSVEKLRERILLAISGRARVRGRTYNSICPPSLNHCCARTVPNYSLGSFSTQSG